jgi:2-dehydropantoate 2-reductase
MKITVLGAGAMGSIIGALLQATGQDVTLVARGARAAMLREQGVRVSGLVDATVPVRIVDDPASLTETDALIVCVKTYDTEAALAGLSNLKPAMALSLQNGVLKDDQLTDTFGAGATVGATADFSGEILPDGGALFTRNECIYVGELSGRRSERVESLVAALTKAGIKSLASEQIRTAEWSKFVTWLGLTPVSVLSRLPSHRFTQDPDLARLLVALTKEAEMIADALDIELQDGGGLLIPETLARVSLDEGIANLHAVGRAMETNGITAHKMSSLQDAERGRRLEVEETVGDAVRRAAELGLPVPALETCYRVLAGISRNAGA